MTAPRASAGVMHVAVVVHLGQAPDEAVAARDLAWQQQIAPLLAALHERPHARVGLVLPGDQVDGWRESQPDVLAALRASVAEGRVELVGAALHEPVLSAIPERDVVAQLQAHVTVLRRAFDVRPTGCWVPWRVWDPALPRPIAQAGLGWAVADPSWLAAIGLTPTGLLRTEREGAAIDLLPGIWPEGRSPDALVDALVADAGRGRRAAAICVDRPTLAALGPAWLPWLLDLLSAFAGHAGASLVVDTPSAVVRALGQGQLAYLPSAAPAEQRCPWERWLAELPEANRLHKRMLQVSREVRALERIVRGGAHTTNRPDPELLALATRHLHRAQHAGAYQPPGALLPRPRARAWRDLLRAERVAREALGVADRVIADSVARDGGGLAEVHLRARGLCAVIDPACGAGLTELSLADPGVNLVATCSASRVGAREHEPHAPRASLRQVVLDPEVSLAELADGASLAAAGWEDEPPWTLVTTETRGDDAAVAVLTSELLVQEPDGQRRVHLTRRYVARPDGSLELRLDLQNRSHDGFRARIGLLVDLAVASEPALQRVSSGTLTVSGSEVADLGASMHAAISSRTARVDVRAASVAHLWHAPITSRVASDAPVVQGSCLIVWWPIELWGRERVSVGITLHASSVHDARGLE